MSRGFQLPRALLIPALLAVVVSGTPAATQESVRSTFDIVGSNTLGQGSPLRYKLTLKNQGDSTRTVNVLFVLVHAASGERVNASTGRVQIPPEAQETLTGSVTSSQWFDQRGVFRLEVKGISARPLRFTVGRSRVPVPKFEDVTESVGIEDSFVAFTTDCGRWAAGAAWADIDGDDDLDLYLPRRSRNGDAGAARLWVNDGGNFEDEASQRGVAVSDGIGAIFGDYDNDGDQDLYAHSEGADHLFENDGTGKFSDVTAEAGVDVAGSSQSATWLDYNYDGYLDLYVTNHRTCTSNTSPADRLLKNDGDGTFSDTTSLLVPPPPEQGPVVGNTTNGAGFQMGWFDYDNDGDHDLYLVNDYWGPRPEPNVLWENQSTETESRFVDVSKQTNAQLVMNSMGLAIGDYDRDLDFDLAISDIRAAALLQNRDGTFRDRASFARVARDTHSAESIAVTWATAFHDLNDDGWEDLYLAAGRLAGSAYQPNELFTNSRDGRFLDHSAPSGADYDGTSKGVAFADFDRDGRVDMYVINQDAVPILYRNVTPMGNKHWLEVDTVGTVSNRDGCGARVIAHVGRASLLRQVFCGGTSLATGSDTVVHFGLGSRESVDRLVIEWPSGIKQVIEDVAGDQLVEITESND